MSSYHTYEVEDFVLDEYFKAWVLHPTTETAQFWNDFMTANPQKQNQIEEARVLVLALSKPEPVISDAQVTDSLRALEAKLEAPEAKQIKLFPAWQQIAAVVTLLVVGVSAWFLTQSLRRDTYQTGFGEIREIMLPDQSVVTLNANSTLTVPARWSGENAREVWLEGEAYFKVQKKPSSKSARFVVHSGGVDVEVLGTQFNVSQRQEQTRVVLTEGKVKLHLTNSAAPQEMIMKPQDAVEIPVSKPRFIKRVVNPAQYTAWKQRRLVLNNIRMQEVAEILEDLYGLPVQFEDPALAQVVLNGTSVPTDNKSILFNALSETLGVSVITQNGKLVFGRAPGK